MRALVLALREVTPATEGLSLRVVREIRTADDDDVLQGLVLVGGRLVPFAAVVRAPRGGQVLELRVYGDSTPWR